MSDITVISCSSVTDTATLFFKHKKGIEVFILRRNHTIFYKIKMICLNLSFQIAPGVIFWNALIALSLSLYPPTKVRIKLFD